MGFDASSQSGAIDTSGASSLTWSHTVAAGSGRVLAVCVGARLAITVSGITFNSVALTRIAGSAGGSTNTQAEWWYLADPDVGTHDVVVSISSPSNRQWGASISGTAIGALADADFLVGGSTPKEVTGTVTTDNGFAACLLSVSASGATISPSQSGQTEVETSSESFLECHASYKEIGSSGSDVEGWNFAGGAETTVSAIWFDKAAQVPNLSYADTTVHENLAMPTLTPANTGDPATSCSVDAGGDPLPTGLTLHNDGTITGTPATGTHGTFTILINNSNANGSGAQATLHLTVDVAIPNIAYTTPQIKPTGTPVTITPTNSGSNATWSVSVGTLPTGYSINSSTGVISGTPTVRTTKPTGAQPRVVTVSATNTGGTDTFDITFGVYTPSTQTVTATNGSGSSSADLVIRLYAADGGGPSPPDIAYPASPIAKNIRQSVDTSPTNSGGAATSYAVTGGDALAPWGLAIDAATGRVTGTLVKSGTFSTQITATGPGGTSAATLEIDVTNIAPVTSWNSPWTPTIGTQPTRSPINTGGDAITNYAEVAGAPNVLADIGAAIDASTGVLSFGSPVAAPPATIVVWLRATNAIGVGNTYVLTISSVAAVTGGIAGPFEIPGVPGRRFIVTEVFPQGPFLAGGGPFG